MDVQSILVVSGCKKVKGNIKARQKTFALKHFSLPRYKK